jgi:hypothetical protein
MKLVKLTKQGRNVLVNVDNVLQIETTMTSGGVLTKLFMNGGNYVLVEETMEDVYNLFNEDVKQDIDWTITSIDEGFEDRMVQQPFPQKRYHNPRPQQQQYRPRNYNNYNTFNDNQY